MKKKWIFISIIIIFIIFILFCVNNQNTKNGINNENIHPSKESYMPALELLYEGKMNGVEFGIGTKYDKIITQWGEPEEYTDSFMGAILIKYGDTYFFVNDNQVTGIYYTGSNEIYGVEIGMDLEQVVEILGSQNDLYDSPYSELYPDEPLILEYKAGKYIVNFEINTENKKVNSICILQDFAQ
ncbi:DUF4309 domain-containing protein [Aminipila sp.]|uniref:DUF4309 domain-containing protein n=1 Tax=Aminipila sp. TaxID=2060095 RepID=UPI00289FBFA3|nr:DUF4309 domain-containing protein [Aminipila sp.]